MAKNPIVRLQHYLWLCKTISPVVSKLDSNSWKPQIDDWDAIIYLASSNLVLPTLYQALRNRNLIEDIPFEVSEALGGFNQLNQMRNQQLRLQMIQVTQTLNQSGIKPVWLKGATLLLGPNWYETDRAMLDLDFWLPNPEDHLNALKILEEEGYYIHPELIHSSDTDHHHFIRRVKNYLPAGIEIHRNLVSDEAMSLMNQSQASNGVIWEKWENLEIGLLTRVDRCMQSYVQCTEMNLDGMCLGHISLMKTLDFIRRYEALCFEDRSVFLARLRSEVGFTNAASFFGYLKYFWSFEVNKSINNKLIKRVLANYQPNLVLNKKIMMLENYARIFIGQLRKNGISSLIPLIGKVPNAMRKLILS